MQKFQKNFVALNKIFSFKSFNFAAFKPFSRINMATHGGNVDRSINENFNKTVNWELAKVWVNPQNNSYWNSLTANPINAANADENLIIAPVTKVGQLEFDRFARKMGIVISREENVYIQDGICKGKRTRIVSSNKQDAANASAIFESSKEKFENPEVYVMHLTNNSEIGTHKRFVFYDNKNRIVLSNTNNLNSLASVVEGIETEKAASNKN